MKSLIIGLLATGVITGTAKAIECSDLPQDEMDKLLIYAESKYRDLTEREVFLEQAIKDTKLEIATREAKRRQQQREQQQAK
jgi:hypothetical protein